MQIVLALFLTIILCVSVYEWGMGGWLVDRLSSWWLVAWRRWSRISSREMMERKKRKQREINRHMNMSYIYMFVCLTVVLTTFHWHFSGGNTDVSQQTTNTDHSAMLVVCKHSLDIPFKSIEYKKIWQLSVHLLTQTKLIRIKTHTASGKTASTFRVTGSRLSVYFNYLFNEKTLSLSSVCLILNLTCFVPFLFFSKILPVTCQASIFYKLFYKNLLSSNNLNGDTFIRYFNFFLFPRLIQWTQCTSLYQTSEIICKTFKLHQLLSTKPLSISLSLWLLHAFNFHW